MLRCHYKSMTRLIQHSELLQRISWIKLTEISIPSYCTPRPANLSVTFSCKRTYRTLFFDIYDLPKALLSTSVVNCKSPTISDTKSNAKLGKDKAKEREIQRKSQEDGSPQILLIDNEGKYMNVTLKVADRIAKKRDLNLVKLEDPTLTGKTKKDVYKLITGKEYHEISRAEKETKSAPGIKGEKALSINGGIAPKDLEAKLQNVDKWLKKGFQIKVTLAAKGLSKEIVDGIFNKIQEDVTSRKGRILQQREKNGDIKFYIAPPKQEKKQKKNKQDEKIANSENSDLEKEKISETS